MPDPGGELHDDVLRRMLEVARHLSGSADLRQILSVIINAMRDTLAAERATVFEYDEARGQLVATVAHGLDPAALSGLQEIRIPADRGLAGQCAQQRSIINVPDAYADDRFDRSIDARTGYRTRSILTVPLLDDDQSLIGVTQVLNKFGGPFDDRDEEIALGLGSLAAVAIRRGRLLEDRLVREKLQRDLQLARQIQQSTVPTLLPRLAGFGLAAWSEPAEETGGDAFDVIGFRTGHATAGDDEADRALLLLADATGHGIGPALAVTQLRAMLRMAARLGADLPARGAPYDRGRVSEAVESLTAAFEIIDIRRTPGQDPKVQFMTGVAANIFNAGVVLGEPVSDWRVLDLRAAYGSMTINGEMVGDGHGSDVMGHPLEPLAWLANKLSEQGFGLSAGMVIITGSIVSPKIVKAGDTASIMIEGLGGAELKVV